MSGLTEWVLAVTLALVLATILTLVMGYGLHYSVDGVHHVLRLGR